MAYRLVYHRWFEKGFAKLPRNYQLRVDKVLINLRISPRDVIAQSRQLKGYSGIYRYRLGKFRLVYAVKDDKQEIIAVGIESRGKVYKMMRRLLG